MSDLSNAIATIAPVAVAPAHPNGQGKSQPAGHVREWRAQPAFPVEAKLNVIGANLWRPGIPSHRFYEEVLAQGPMTVQECIDKAGALAEPFTAKTVQRMLRWMFTANGAFLEVDGKPFVAPPDAPPAVKQVKRPAKSKSQRMAEVVAKSKVAAKAATKKVAVKKSKKVA